MSLFRHYDFLWRCDISKVCEITSRVKQVGQDDPRRITHSLKVGFAITLVSLFYYCQPLYNSFGASAIWAVMTVIVIVIFIFIFIFEFSVGATLGRGLNRGLATLVAGALGVGAHHLACLSGHVGEPILLGALVFLQAATSTFIRFFPKIKARYDYGLLIFIATFCLISVSGFRDDEVLELAHKRLSTILIGGSACVLVTILVFPVWAGEDLHNLMASNIEKLGCFLEGFGSEYFKTLEDTSESKDHKAFLLGYKSVLNSKSSEESLANFARWEPGHGTFSFRHPWSQYLKVGALVRQCAYRIEALHGRLITLTAENQMSPVIRSRIEESYTKLSMESGKALRVLASDFMTMKKSPSADPHIANAKDAAKSLKSILKSGLWDDDIDLLQVVPVATVGSLLLDVVNCTEQIVESVYELRSIANFVSVELEKNCTENEEENPKMECPHVVLEIAEVSHQA